MTQSQKEFEKLIRRKGGRLTSERLALIDGIRHERGHFNVDMLVSCLKRKGLKASRDTVYRNIPILLEAGILEQSFKTNRDTFYEATGQKSHHDHLMCRKCGKVVEFKDGGIEKIQHAIAKRNSFKLDYHCHQLIGLCRKCQK